MATDETEARRRKLLEQILADGARVADVAASSPQPGHFDISWLLQVHKLQNVLNNQIYGLCLGLLNSSLAALQRPETPAEHKANGKNHEAQERGAKVRHEPPSPTARASSQDRRVTYSKLSPKSSARQAPSSTAM